MKFYSLIIIMFLNLCSAYAQICPTYTLPNFISPCSTINLSATTCGPQFVCMKDSVCLTIQITGNADSAFIEWEDGVREVFAAPYNGVRKFKYAINPRACYSPDGKCVLYIYVGAWQNCPTPEIVNLIAVPVTLMSSPSALFSISPDDTICSGQQACFNLSCNSFYQNTTFLWDFGDGTGTSTASNPCYTYINPPANAIYNVTLTDTNICGSDTHSEQVHIVQSNVSFTTNINQDSCASVVFSPTVTSNNISTYSWTISPSNVGNTIVPPNNDTTVVTFNIPGIYTLNLSSTGRCCSFGLSNDCHHDTTFTINAGPQISDSSISDRCALSPIIFNSAPYFWNFGTNTSMNWNVYENGALISSTSGFTPPVFNIDSGTYAIEVVFANSCGTDTVRNQFQVFNPAVLQLPVSDTLCASADSIVLQASPYGGNWEWNGTALNDSVFYPSVTNDTIVYFTYEYGIGQCAVRDSFYYYLPGANVDAGTDISVCGNTPSIALTSGFPTGGTWSNSPAISGTNYITSLLPTGQNHDTLIYTVNAGGSCQVSDTLLISVFSLGSMTTSITDTACVGQLVQFNSGSSNSSDTITWYFGDGVIVFDSLVAHHAYSLAQSYQISVILQNSGCIDSTHENIVIIPGPNPVLSITNQSCSPLMIHAANQSPDSLSSSFSWWIYELASGDTIISYIGSQLPDTSLGIGISDTTQYVIVLQDSGICDNIKIADTLTVFPKPKAFFGPTCISCCQYDSVTFVNTSVGYPTIFNWYVDNLSVGSSMNIPPYVFTTTGVHTVTLVAQNSCGLDSLSYQLSINPSLVQAGFNIVPITNHCRPLTVQFNSFSTQGSVNQFYFGDGNFALGDTVVHIYNSPGNFLITLISDGACGLDSITMPITVDDTPNLGIGITNILCNNQAVQFENTSQDSLAQILWYFGDGDSSSLSNPSHIYSTITNTYLVTMVGTSLNTGCVDTITQSIILLNSPTAAFTLSDSSACEDRDTLYFTSNSVGSAFNWDFGDGTFSSNNPTYHVYTNQGNYTIHLTVTGSNQCFDDTSISTLAVHLLPVPEFIASQSAMCQTPAIVHLNNQSTGAISYEWFTPALGVFSQASDPVISFQSTVQLPVTLIAETPFCRDSVTHPVFAYAETQAGFISDTLAGCQPLTLQFEDSSKNVTSLLWDFGNNNFSNSSSPSFYYSEAGIYQATLYANYDSVCFDSASVQINILDGPDADFTYRDTTIDDMVFHQFFNQSQCDDTCTFLWAFDDAEFSTLENPIHQYWSNARRCVSLTITSSNGCLSTKIICLDINLPGVLSIPNALIPTLIPDLKGYFAPNGYNLETFEIEIVSPWGERVWHSLNELDENGTPTSKWNGTHYQNGNDLPMGGYVWRVLKATFRNHMEWKGMIYENNTDPIKCGSVLLTR